MKNFVYGIICLLFILIALILFYTFFGPWLKQVWPVGYMPSLVVIPLIFGVVGLSLAPLIMGGLDRLTNKSISRLNKVSLYDLVCSVLGLITGLIIAALIGISISKIAIIGPYLSIIVLVFFGYVGLTVGYKKREDFRNFFRSGGKTDRKSVLPSKIPPKILDTSVIIDGRIADIYKTGFIEGDLIIPNFVLEELRHIADSSDQLRRNRGRRGLDILNMLRQEFKDNVLICETDYPDISEVDSKLLKLTSDLDGLVLTNDFNLNKVAQLQGVKVLNINELSNAVKPVVLPGEEMVAQIVKDGKESGQGVAYLEDGTMIVVENGKRHVNKTIMVIVTSVLQTAAGRMIFAKPKYTLKGDVEEVG